MMGEGPTTSTAGGIGALMQMLAAQGASVAQPHRRRHKPVEAGELFPQVNSHSTLLAGLQAVHHRHLEARMKSPAGAGGGAY